MTFIEYIDDIYGIRVLKESREAELVNIRFIIMHIFRCSEMKVCLIAEIFGMHHSSIIHGIQTCMDRLECEESFRNLYDEIFDAYVDCMKFRRSIKNYKDL